MYLVVLQEQSAGSHGDEGSGLRRNLGSGEGEVVPQAAAPTPAHCNTKTSVSHCQGRELARTETCGADPRQLPQWL